jgi:hypothetical protein
MNFDVSESTNTAIPAAGQSHLTPEEEFLDLLGMKKLPYISKLSFVPLIQMIEQKAQSEENTPAAALAQHILNELNKYPELLGDIEDKAVLRKYPEVLQLLMMMLIPQAISPSQMIKVSAPFEMTPIYCTNDLKSVMESDNANYVISQNKDVLNCMMVVNACSLILNKYYGQALDVTTPVGISIQWPGEEIERFYKVEMNAEFIEIKKTKPLKKLSQDQINQLLSNIYDIDVWLEHIPPENFEFVGFAIGTLLDITTENALSQLKYALLEKDAVVEQKNVNQLRRLLRTYFNMPGLELGITAIDYPLEDAVHHKYKIRYDFLSDQVERLLVPEHKNSIYEKACRFREVLLIEDLQAVSVKTPIEEALIKKGISSIIVAPLLNKNEKVIGLLEIGAPEPFQLHSFIELKFKEIIGLFSMAVERSREEIDNRIEAIIREQYTAVHPSVEWKFIETSYRLLEKREKDPQNAIVDPIVFNDVYPLYAQADIVSSSVIRNQSIQADLIDNLNRAKKVLSNGLEQSEYPLLRQIKMKVEQNLHSIESDFSSNDESRIVEWLQEEIHPLFNDLRIKFPELASSIANYFGYLDEDFGIVYRQRKDYEDSVTMINNAISNYLEEQQKKAQAILPHYFEKYKTDGVEYDLYVGQSLLNRTQFNMLHLKNLRLWQLIDMCEVTRLVESMQNRLPVPLTTAQLIFAYTSPLSIRFVMDEKKFDVDGAYNVRYEILKKRIDKALIDGTSERLTQAGKIAIVYLQEKDRLEYMEFATFLQHEGYITEEVEDLKLGKLQGVHGLRALRMTVVK